MDAFLRCFWGLGFFPSVAPLVELLAAAGAFEVLRRMYHRLELVHRGYPVLFERRCIMPEHRLIRDARVDAILYLRVALRGLPISAAQIADGIAVLAFPP